MSLKSITGIDGATEIFESAEKMMQRNYNEIFSEKIFIYSEFIRTRRVLFNRKIRYFNRVFRLLV